MTQQSAEMERQTPYDIVYVHQCKKSEQARKFRSRTCQQKKHISLK